MNIQNDMNYLQIGLQICELSLEFINLVDNWTKRHRVRRWWCKPLILYNYLSGYNNYERVFKYFKLNDEEEFLNFTRMRVQLFEYVYNLVRERLVKRSKRPPLPTEVRFSITVNYLAHGDSMKKNKWFNSIGLSTIYTVISEVCNVLCEILTPMFVKFPTTEQFQVIAKQFTSDLHFPNCLGALDGKHCRIVKPPNSGGLFFNYKKFHSIVLMACCDSKKRFIWVNIGDYGSLNDAGIFANSDLGRALSANEIELPPPKPLPNSEIVIPFFFIGDGGFPLKEYLIKPFLRNENLTMPHRAFNFRLSHARRIIESAFGQLAEKWLVHMKPIGFKNLSITENVVMSTICLHNILIDFECNELGNRWNDVIENIEERNFERHAVEEFRIRQQLCEYFISPEGSVPWQWARM